MPRAGSRISYECVVCSGDQGRPRNGEGGQTCSAKACKDEYARRRKAAKLLGDSAAADGDEVMPRGMWVHTIKELLGERCCKPSMKDRKKRKNGPGNAY